MFAKALAFRMGTSASATRNARTKALRSSGWQCIWLPGSKLTSAFSRVRRHVFVPWTDAELKEARPGPASAATTERQRPLLPYRPARLLARGARHDAYPRQALSPDDPGQDRALPPLQEEPDPARELLPARSARSAPGRVRRLLQFAPVPRKSQQPNPGRCLLRSWSKTILTRRENTKLKTIELRRRRHHAFAATTSTQMDQTLKSANLSKRF